jgi:UDP-N-acetylmuramoyl-tripeptide--D-alanyl-D-alanine ligase
VRYYGLSPEAEVRAEDVVGRGLRGVEFTLVHGGRRLRVRMPLLGVQSVHAALAGTTVALAHGLDLEEAAAGLGQISPSLRIVVEPGINGVRLIDDSYNMSPESALAALNLLEELEGRKVAVLGDMFELGAYEEQGHRQVGQRAGHVADVLVTVGTRARWIADEARRVAHPPATVQETTDHAEAIVFLERTMRPGDNVLVKGSRGMEMERLVAALRRERGE